MLCGERILQDVNSQVSITIRDFPMYRIISIEKSLIGKREKAPQSRVLLLCPFASISSTADVQGSALCPGSTPGAPLNQKNNKPELKVVKWRTMKT